MLNYISRANHAVVVYKSKHFDAGKLHKMWHNKSLPYDPQRNPQSYDDVNLLNGRE